MAGKNRKHVKTPNLLERVLVPVASTAVLTTAAIKSVARRDRDSGVDGEGPDPGRPRPAREPERTSALDRIAARLPWLRPLVAVQRRYGEVGGNHLAAAFTLQAFLSVFPLVLVGIAVLGFVSAGSDTDLAGRLVDQLGLQGESARVLTDAVSAAESSRKAASLVGFLGLLWSGLGLVAALQYASNAVWQVRARGGVKDRAFGLVWLGGAAVLFVGGAAATTALRWLPGFLAPAGVLVTFAVSLGLWLWTLAVLPNRTVPWRRLLPGAVLGAVGLEVLKFVGAYYVPRAVASSSQLYGSLGIVFAVLAWLLLFGRLMVYSVVLNAVRFERGEGTVGAVVEAPPVPGARPRASRSGRRATTG